MQLLQVSTGQIREIRVGDRGVPSAIGKSERTGPVAVGPLGLERDEQADLSVHGGRSRAVYAYPAEHLPFWQTVRAQAQVAPWGEPLAPGLLGQNLLLQGLRETEMWVGDRLLLPHGVLAISAPRYPCAKFNAVMGFPKAAKLMVESGFCGCYLSVIEPGTLQAGDPITLQPGPRELNIRDLFKARTRG